MNLGNIFTDLKLYNQARFYYALAQAQFAEARNALGFVDSKIAFGLSLEAEGALSEAIDLYRDTLATFAEINEALTAKLRFYLGQALWQNRQGEEAYQALHAAHQSAIALGWAGLAESCQRALALLETEQEQVEAEFQPVDSSPEDELDATAPYPRAYSVHKTLRTFKEGICSLDDFANEINQRFTYPDPIVRVQSMLLLKEALPFLEDRHDTWQRFSSLAEDPNALVRTVFCVYCTNHCRVLGKLDEGVSILLSLTHDEDADVRAMSLSGLAELYRTLSDEQRQRIEERFNQVADDEEEHVQLAAKRFREHFYT